MSFEDVRVALVDAFKTSFESSNPTVPIMYENIKFDQPEGLPWAYITVVHGNSRRMELSSRAVFRHEGVVSVWLMGPRDTGVRTITQLAQDAWEIFADKEFSVANGKITTHMAEVMSRGVVNGFYTMIVQVDFRADQTIS